MGHCQELRQALLQKESILSVGCCGMFLVAHDGQLRPQGSDLVSPPVTDDGRCGASSITPRLRADCPQPKPKEARRQQAQALVESAIAIQDALNTPPPPPPQADIARPARATKRKWRKWAAQDGELGFACSPNCECDNDIAPTKPPPGLLCPLGGLKAKGPQLMTSGATGITWEKVTLTVDSGASDTVVPPHYLR